MIKGKYSVVIGIDPDVDKNGFALLDVQSRKITLESLTFPQLCDRLSTCIQTADEEQSRTLIVVEAGWLNRSNWHIKRSDAANIAASIGRRQGRNEQRGKDIIEQAEHYIEQSNGNAELIHVAPLAKCWGGRDKKITHEELARFMDIPKRSNQEERDAALLAWTYAKLPIRLKPKY